MKKILFSLLSFFYTTSLLNAQDVLPIYIAYFLDMPEEFFFADTSDIPHRAIDSYEWLDQWVENPLLTTKCYDENRKLIKVISNRLYKGNFSTYVYEDSILYWNSYNTDSVLVHTGKVIKDRYGSLIEIQTNSDLFNKQVNFNYVRTNLLSSIVCVKNSDTLKFDFKYKNDSLIIKKYNRGYLSTVENYIKVGNEYLIVNYSDIMKGAEKKFYYGRDLRLDLMTVSHIRDGVPIHDQSWVYEYNNLGQITDEKSFLPGALLIDEYNYTNGKKSSVISIANDKITGRQYFDYYIWK